jgi:alpha-ketoglutaric semialdehyde dehydrogenase
LRERTAQIAEGLKSSVTLGVGQFCTKPGLVFGLQDANFDAFREILARGLEAMAPATMLHPGIYDSFRAGMAQASVVNGVSLLAQSRQPGDPAKTQGASVMLCTTAANFRNHPELAEEVFGPFSLLISAESFSELEQIAGGLAGQLTATIHGTTEDLGRAGTLLKVLERKAGRLVINGFPTGVEVCSAMNHGGPYPATTDVRFTSVGAAALLRFVRPVCYQNFPSALLPEALKDENPLGLRRMIDGEMVVAGQS